WPKKNPPRWVPWPASFDHQPAHPALRGSSCTTKAWGWPLRAVCWSRATLFSQEELLYVSEDTLNFVWRGASNDLPGHVIWTGMIEDSILFSGAFLLLIRGPGILKRWLRRRAGGCVTCGYTKLGLDPASACPECGSKS